MFRSTSASLINTTRNNPNSHAVGLAKNTTEEDYLGIAATSNDYVPTKTVSCENVSTAVEGRATFPHSFLRSRPKSTANSKPPNLPVSERSSRTPSFKEKIFSNEVFDQAGETLRDKLRAVSEDNFPITWLRKSQTSIKMKINSSYSKFKSRSPSTLSVNNEMIIYHSPVTAVGHNNRYSLQDYNNSYESQWHETPNSMNENIADNFQITPNSCISKLSPAKRKVIQSEYDADSGVSSTGSHSETNSDSGSLIGNDSSFDQNFKHDSLAFRLSESNKSSDNNNINLSQIPSEYITNESSLNLINEAENNARISKEQGNIVTLRNKFIESQLNRQSAHIPRCSTPKSSSKSLQNPNAESNKISRWLGRSNCHNVVRKSNSDGCSSSPLISGRKNQTKLPIRCKEPRSLKTSPLVSPPRTFRLIRVSKDVTGELGIYIAANRNEDGEATGYVIAHLEPGGVTDRYEYLAICLI